MIMTAILRFYVIKFRFTWVGRKGKIFLFTKMFQL